MLLKMIKRMMAGEYLRDLSLKVWAGQVRISSQGFKLGGIRLFGLQRLLIGADGQPKMLLRDGERKSLITDRVTYTLGPAEEIQVVPEIYSMFLEQNLTMIIIARLLNQRGLRNVEQILWTLEAARPVLTHSNHVGCAVFNRSSIKLKGKIVRNRPTSE